MSLHEYVKEGIVCLKPVYRKGVGNATQIITVPGNSYIDTRVTRSVVKHLARLYGVDLNAVRKKYGKLVGQKNMVPIPFNHNIVLMPLKLRKPITKNDGTTGYINIVYLKKVIDDGEHKSCAILRNGIKVQCLMRFVTLQKHVRNARIVLNHYRSQHSPVDLVYLNKGEASKPATKGDIALLIKEILCLKEKLG